MIMIDFSKCYFFEDKSPRRSTEKRSLRALSIASDESSQQISMPSNSSQCPQCDAVFAHRCNMLRHVKAEHEGVKYPCSKCDYKATYQCNLKRHVKSVHEGVRYSCSQCD